MKEKKKDRYREKQKTKRGQKNLNKAKMRSKANKNKARKTKMRGRIKRKIQQILQRKHGKCVDNFKTHNKEQHTCTITEKIKRKSFKTRNVPTRWGTEAN